MQRGEREKNARTTTQLLDGALLDKSDQRFEVLGALDELSSQLSLFTCALDEKDAACVKVVLEELWLLSSEVVACGASSASDRLERIRAARDALFEHAPRGFVHFHGCHAAAQADLARAVCRRAERELVRLAQERPGEVAEEQLLYLDVLSDWLFLFACRLAGTRDVRI